MPPKILNPSREYESLLGEYRVLRRLTIKELCERAGVLPSVYCALQNGMVAPVYLSGSKSGVVKPAAQNLCKVLRIDVEDAFPRYFCKIRDEATDFSDDQLLEILHGTYLDRQIVEERTIQKDLFEKALEALSSLADARIKTVVLMVVCQNETLEDVGKKYGVSKDRISQLVWKGLIKCRKAFAILKTKQTSMDNKIKRMRMEHAPL